MQRPAAPAPAQLQGQQGMDPVIGALDETGGLKQLLAVSFSGFNFLGDCTVFRGIYLSCRRIFPAGFACMRREES